MLYLDDLDRDLSGRVQYHNAVLVWATTSIFALYLLYFCTATIPAAPKKEILLCWVYPIQERNPFVITLVELQTSFYTIGNSCRTKVLSKKTKTSCFVFLCISEQLPNKKWKPGKLNSVPKTNMLKHTIIPISRRVTWQVFRNQEICFFGMFGRFRSIFLG